MKRDNINYLAVGTFVVAMGVVLLVVLYKITGRTGPTDQYHVSYSNVAGIKFGTGVFYEGFQVGQVDSITPERRADGLRYDIEFSVIRGWQIPQDSVAKIVASGLLSAVSIDISEGKSSSLLQPGSEIKGQDQVNIFAALNDVAGQFGSLSEDGFKPFLRNLNARIEELTTEYTDLSASTLKPFVHSMQKRLDDKKMWDDFGSLLSKLDGSAAELQKLLGEDNQQYLTQILANISEASTELNSRLEETRLKMNEFLDRTNSLLATNSDDVSGAVADTRVAAAELKSSLQRVSEHIDAVMYHLEGGSRQMHEFAREIRENPGLLLRGSPQPDQ